MAKKKKLISKKAQNAQRKKKSAQQQIWRVQNKLDQPRLSKEVKRDLEKRLEEAKRAAGYKGPTKREEKRLDKEKRSLAAKRSKLGKEFESKKTTQKRRNQIRKELMETSKRFNEINKKLGKKEKKAPKKEKGIATNDIIIVEEPTWVVRPDHIDPVVRGYRIDTATGKKIKSKLRPKKYMIEDPHTHKMITIPKSRPDDVYSKWYALERAMLNQGSSGIAVITYDFKAKIFTIDWKK